MKQQAMQISKAQTQQQMKHSQHKDKSKGIFGLIILAAIAGATYIAVNSDNPFVFLAFMGVMAFIVSGNEEKRKNDDITSYERLHYNIFYNPAYKDFETNIFHNN